MKFSEFNSIVNPNNENVYVIETSSKKKNLVGFDEAKAIVNIDPTAVIYWRITKTFFVITVKEKEVVDAIIDLNEKVMVVKHKDVYEIYCQGSFNKCTTNNILACGITADTLAPVAKKNIEIQLPFTNKKVNTSPVTKDIEIIHANGISSTPPWLKPLRIKNHDFADGIQVPLTNNVRGILNNHLSRLYGLGLNKYEQQEILNIINKYFCATPMTNDELQNIIDMLQENLLSKFMDGKEFYHNKLGDFAIEACNIKRDEKSKKLYFYNPKKNIYTDDQDYLMGYLTRLCPQLKQFQKDETKNYILNNLYDDSVAFNKEEYSVVFKNGILNVLDWTFEPMTPDHYESIQINVNYNPKATSSTADEFFATATCKDKEVEQLLYEAIGYSMLKTTSLAKAFILTGSGRNGKSTYLDVIKGILGTSNYTSISFKDLSNQFRASALAGKLASIAGDISSTPISDSDIFKSIVASEEIQLEKKYEQSYTDKVFATMLFSCNALPPTPDTSNGFYRRLAIIPFNANLAKVSSVDGVKFHNALTSQESLEYIAYKAVCAIHKVLTSTNEFIEPKVVKEMLLKYKIASSSALSFYKDKYLFDLKRFMHKTAEALFKEYNSWCLDTNRKCMGLEKFIEVTYQEFNFKLKRKPVQQSIN